MTGLVIIGVIHQRNALHGVVVKNQFIFPLICLICSGTSSVALAQNAAGVGVDPNLTLSFSMDGALGWIDDDINDNGSETYAQIGGVRFGVHAELTPNTDAYFNYVLESTSDTSQRVEASWLRTKFGEHATLLLGETFDNIGLLSNHWRKPGFPIITDVDEEELYERSSYFGLQTRDDSKGFNITVQKDGFSAQVGSTDNRNFSESAYASMAYQFTLGGHGLRVAGLLAHPGVKGDDGDDDENAALKKKLITQMLG